jgi:hypothetical protein
MPGESRAVAAAPGMSPSETIPGRNIVPCSANADALPFEEIAKRPNFTESGLATFLLDPHAKMPNMNLTRFEAGDIAAYVGKLR